MRKRSWVTIAVGSVAGLAFVAPTWAGGNKYPPSEAVRDCGDGDTVVYNGPLKLWPPNHKMVDVSVTATDGASNPVDGAAGGTTISVMPEATDAMGGDGGPNHDPDWTPEDIMASGDPSATADFQLRAERSGKGDGRTYTLHWVATFDNGTKECSSMDMDQSPFLVLVPHDMSGGADWK